MEVKVGGRREEEFAMWRRKNNGKVEGKKMNLEQRNDAKEEEETKAGIE